MWTRCPELTQSLDANVELLTLIKEHAEVDLLTGRDLNVTQFLRKCQILFAP